MNEIPNIIESSEKIEWEGKPKASAYFITNIFMIILIIGIFEIGFYLSKTTSNKGLWMIGIGALGILILITTILSYKFTAYAITNKRVILQSGIIGRDFKSIDHDQIVNVSLNVGLAGVIFKTGEIKIFTGEIETTTRSVGRGRNSQYSTSTKSKYDTLSYLPDTQQILKIIQSHITKRKENLYAGRT